MFGTLSNIAKHIHVMGSISVCSGNHFEMLSEIQMS